MRSSAGGGASFSSSSCLGCAITGFGRGSGGEGAETLLTGGLGAAVGGGMGACGGRRTPAWIPDGRPAADAEVGLGRATMLMPFISPLATLPNPVAPPAQAVQRRHPTWRGRSHRSGSLGHVVVRRAGC